MADILRPDIVLDTRTAAQRKADDVGALLRARVSLIWIVTNEERRIERQVIRVAAACQYQPFLWDSFSGLCNADGSIADSDLADSVTALINLRDRKSREVWIMRDLPREMTPDGKVIRAVRSLARLASEAPRPEARALVILSPSKDVPPELASVAAVLEWPSPDREEIATILDGVVGAQREEIRNGAIKPGERDRVIDAAIGLSGEAVETAYSHALVMSRRIEPKTISAEKRRLIRGDGLEWFEPLAGGLDEIGGLDLFKAWLSARAAAFSPAARAYGLPRPRGVLLTGIPGTGKSMAAKAAATALGGLPLIRLDLGALSSKWVGESEAKMRSAIRTVEAMAPAVLWVDEIEKALQGAVSGSADGGVSADKLAVLLTAMQESKAGIFFFATANDVSALPPELLRKGRFDDIFFVDLPQRGERRAVLAASLKSRGRNADDLDLDLVAEVTDGFTGAELDALVPDALFAAFADGGRPLATGDLIAAANATVPMSRTRGDRVAAIRTWAKGRARPASSLEVEHNPGRAVEGI